MIVFTKSNQRIELDSKTLGSPGKEGTVYKVINSYSFDKHCVKIFTIDKRIEAKEKVRLENKKRKIEYMILNKPKNIEAINYTFCWPVELVYDSSGQFIGFVMPIAFNGSEKLYELTNTKISSRLNSTWEKFQRTASDAFHKRLKLCVNLASATHALHQTRKYFLIDFKPQNVLINIEGKISIIDLDSVQILSPTGNVLFKADAQTPEYIPTEFYIPNSIANENWDRFSLAVIFYELLLGIHPYAATTCKELMIVAESIGQKIEHGLFVHGSKKNFLRIPRTHEAYNLLSPELKKLFMKAFSNELIIRPSAEQWGITIYEELSKKIVHS